MTSVALSRHRAMQDYLLVPLVFYCSNIILVMVYFIYPSEHHLILITALQAGIQPSNYPSNYPAAYRCGLRPASYLLVTAGRRVISISIPYFIFSSPIISVKKPNYISNTSAATSKSPIIPRCYSATSLFDTRSKRARKFIGKLLSSFV